MKQSGAPTRLADVVLDLASEVVFALRSGDHPPVCGPDGIRDDQIRLAAVRVLGADVLLPGTLHRQPPPASDVAALRQAVDAFPPSPDAADTTLWSHWGMADALRRLAAHPSGPPPDDAGLAILQPSDADTGVDTELSTEWLRQAPWQQLTHQLAVLSPLAVPGADSAVARVARDRTVDVARGFVRAVRRRDWLQAAGAGRWLALLDRVPDSLGLETGLDFVELMGGEDSRVALQLQAARMLADEGVR
ncbi:hypothetical protein [Streptomyces sp. NPDC005438]|uniref:hypothetical protein n=1 Tax=Streptomyces sp. NPDC005438 TaxID=3156880 RepID=UPI0033A2FB0F